MEVEGAESEKNQKGRGIAAPSLASRLKGTKEEAPKTDGGPGPIKSVEGWVLIVTGVHEEAQEEDLHEAFAEYGDVRAIHLNLDRRTGFVKGYALIEYAEREEAEKAIADLDGKEILTQTVHVAWAFVGGKAKRN